jgi:hypothetical protein
VPVKPFTDAEIEIALVRSLVEFEEKTRAPLSRVERALFRAAFAYGVLFGHDHAARYLRELMEREDDHQEQ